MFLLMPILIVVSGGLSLFMSTILKQMDDFVLLAPIMKFMIRLIPFVLTWLMFTGLYIFMPNTKVKFKHALIAGILAGSAYQAFQFLYINSQLWVSKYNAIYGSFAALPLFLLWLQISWTICLFGAELTYAGQNIRSFSFDQDTRNISRRYRDFISILIMSLIAKRFKKNEPPYTAAKISEEHQIPIRLTNQVLYQLQEIELIHEVVTDEKSEEIGYQPSMDINQLNVAILLDRLDTYGSENFKIDKDEEFNDEWKVLTESREEYYKKLLLGDFCGEAFGGEIRELFLELDREGRELVLSGWLRSCRTGSALAIFLDMVQGMVRDSIVYHNQEHPDELLIYTRQKKSKELVRRMELIVKLFLDIRYQAEIFYEYHFGIIGMEETMQIGEIAIYSGQAERL